MWVESVASKAKSWLSTRWPSVFRTLAELKAGSSASLKYRSTCWGDWGSSALASGEERTNRACARAGPAASPSTSASKNASESLRLTSWMCPSGGAHGPPRRALAYDFRIQAARPNPVPARPRMSATIASQPSSPKDELAP